MSAFPSHSDQVASGPAVSPALWPPVLGFELSALCLQAGALSLEPRLTPSTPPPLLFALAIFKIGSLTFAWGGTQSMLLISRPPA
jgi:hypothetical protein